MIQAEVLYGIFIPFAGTFLGSACVFFLRNTMSDRVGRALTGFAAGVMVAAFYLESSDTRYGRVLFHGQMVFSACGRRRLGGDSVSASAGSCDSASAQKQ